MSVQKGDFILIDYVARIKETGEVFDTTIEEVAKKEKIYKEDAIYEPMLVVVGEGWVLKGLDEGLVGFEMDKLQSIEIPPEKGFGVRDPSKIKLMPLRRFRARDIAPYPGMQLELDGKLAVIRAVGAGRVQVDFNPPFAGKTLVYDVTVKKILKDKMEEISALIHRRIPMVTIDKIGLELNQKAIRVEVPEDAFYLDGLQYAKRGIANDLQKFFPEVEVVTFVENFRKKSAVAEAPKPQETAPEGT